MIIYNQNLSVLSNTTTSSPQEKDNAIEIPNQIIPTIQMPYPYSEGSGLRSESWAFNGGFQGDSFACVAGLWSIYWSYSIIVPGTYEIRIGSNVGIGGGIGLRISIPVGGARDSQSGSFPHVLFRNSWSILLINPLGAQDSTVSLYVQRNI